MKYEIEITRHNVTPAAFLSYVRSQLKKHGLEDVFEAPSLDYLAAGNDLNFDTEHDGMHERSISKPYETQTYIRWEDGTVYNLMCEFDFWDEKTGTGYFYAKDTSTEAHQEAQEAQEATESESVQEAQEAPAEKPVKALRSNSKQARENIRDYIMDHYTGGSAGYDNAPADNCRDFPTIANFLWNTFQQEKRYADYYIRHCGGNLQMLFQDWCQGLPSVIDTCYYYNRDAKPEVKAILQQTDAEANKYTEEAACDYLTYLIYREITREVK